MKTLESDKLALAQIAKIKARIETLNKGLMCSLDTVEIADLQMKLRLLETLELTNEEVA